MFDLSSRFPMAAVSFLARKLGGEYGRTPEHRHHWPCLSLDSYLEADGDAVAEKAPQVGNGGRDSVIGARS
jgi:hypothetical protein